MDYELVNQVDNLNPEVLKAIKKRLKKSNGKLLCLNSVPNMRNFLQANDIQGTTLIDIITKRKYNPKSYRFFNEINIPTASLVQVLKDGSIFVEHDGDFIGREFLFSNTRRAAQDVRFLNSDGSLDYIEEYSSDGQLYSNLLYANGILQEIIFFNMKDEAIIRYFFYDGVINLITIEDPKKHQVVSSYDSLIGFMIEQIYQNLNKQDKVNINYLGVELSVLKKSQTENTYYLNEDPLDENGQVRSNLKAILTNEIPYIEKVVVSWQAYKKIKHTKLPLDKIKVNY